jgi:sugar (pentulose or hexulose) kinase
MEGVAFQMRWALEYAIDYGQAITRIRAVGGGTMGSEWTQLIADVLDRRLEAVDAPQDAAAVGAAACAIVGSGAQSDYTFLRDRAAVKRTYLPDGSRALEYSERYAHYRKLYEALYPIHHPTSGDEE